MKLAIHFEYVFLFCLFVLKSVISSTDNAVVKIQAGSIKGGTEVSRNGRHFHQFLGIPYGHVPARFMESEPAKPWAEVKDVTDYGPSCLQPGLGDEDCLVINVYTPYLPGEGKEKLPVLFFIHGGAFIIGTSKLYGATYFMDEDVVLVTINYRLGPFGFLNLGIDQAPGNQGLKDQLLALKWVNDNIHVFNGDKSQVTIFGESAGAASVSFLMLTPLSKGLFNRAISQSGTALCSWALNPKGEDHALVLGKKLKCAGSKEEILACLQKADGMELLKVIPAGLVPKNLGEEGSDFKAMSFIPTVEKRPPSDKSSIYLAKSPLELLREGTVQNVPWIIGVNAAEGLLFTKAVKTEEAHTVKEIKSLWMKIGPDALNYVQRPDKDKITEKIHNFYFGDRTNVQDNSTDLCSDRMFNYCSEVAATIYAKTNPVYLYRFDKKGGFSLMSFFMNGGEIPLAPTHADELTYQWNFISLFIPEDESIIGPKHQFYQFSHDFVKMWTQFAGTGKPMTQWNAKAIQWDPIDSKNPGDHKWLHLDDDAKMMGEDLIMMGRMKFWEELNID